MNKRNYLLMASALLAAGSVFTACSSDDENGGGGEAFIPGDYVISAKAPAKAGSGEANYILTSESIDGGQITTLGNGLEASTGTEWVFYKDKYLFRLQYNQGEAGTTESYFRNAAGNVEQRAILYSIKNRFTTFGTYGNNIITAASVDMDATDGSQYKPKGIGLTYLDAVNERFSSKTINAENLLGTGEYVTFSGMLETNGRLYTAVIPMGMSAYGIEKHPDMVVDQSLIATASSGTGSHGSSAGTITGTQHPDEAWVAIYSDDSFSGEPTLIKTDKISYACGRMRSQYYQTIWAADNGDVYVFSPNYSRTMDTEIQKSDLPSGVVRIKAGAKEFDPNYYVNIEQAAGAPLYRCWHLTGNYFLLQLYTNGFNINGAGTTRLAIFNGTDKSVRTVEGLPATDVISSFSKFPYSENGMGYIGVTTTDGAQPAIYRIDPATARATKGLTVDSSTDISAIGVLR